MKDYKFDVANRLYIRNGYAGIGYADGSETQLLKIIDAIKDRSTFSEEFMPHMKSWATEYHFSRKRHLVLRPFEIKPGHKVLELGSGCGAITRYLAELGAEVTAVEGELSRAKVAAKRCEGYENVKFLVDDLTSLRLEEKYDWVLLIGVLEYSEKYGVTANKPLEYLNLVKRHLEENGTLLVAIENKLGIKYLNGAGEDHNGKLFYGPQDLYADRDVTTWGKSELSQYLVAAGFDNIKFFTAFPDYKLPKAIFSENVDTVYNFRPEELLHYSRSLDYRGANTRNYDESLVMGSLRKNRLFTEFGNSFVIAASVETPSPVASKSDNIGYYYSVDRKREFCAQTVFNLNLASKNISVSRRLIGKRSEFESEATTPEVTNDNTFAIRHRIDADNTEYIQGELLGQRFSKAVLRRDMENICNLLTSWKDLLLDTFQLYCSDSRERLRTEGLLGRELRSVMIDGEALDAGLHNVIIGESSQFFDLEWSVEEPIPFAWVLIRNITVACRLKHLGNSAVDPKQILKFLCSRMGLTISETDFSTARDFEALFQRSISYVEPSSRVSVSLGKSVTNPVCA